LKTLYNPNFKYTNKMVKLLTNIAVSREIIINSPLIPKWEITLRSDAIIRSAHSSTSIEGNRLSFEQVSALAEGREIMASRKDKQEVLNYLKVLENIDKFTESGIEEEGLLKIHQNLTSGTLEDASDSGVYRNKYVVVANRHTGEIIFSPPKNNEVPELIKALIIWINSAAANECDPVIAAGCAHYEFVRIHPFVDGNGRTARVLAAIILFLKGFDTKRFFCLDDYYDSDRPAYYKALQSVNPKNIEITEWLEYFIEGVSVSINAVKERVIRLSSERLRKTVKGQVALTERQMKIVEKIVNNHQIKIGDIALMFNITRQAALKEISKLIKLKVVKLSGRGKNSCYALI